MMSFTLRIIPQYAWLHDSIALWSTISKSKPSFYVQPYYHKIQVDELTYIINQWHNVKILNQVLLTLGCQYLDIKISWQNTYRLTSNYRLSQPLHKLRSYIVSYGLNYQTMYEGDVLTNIMYKFVLHVEVKSFLIQGCFYNDRPYGTTKFFVW